MARADEAAIESGVPGEVLMERAGRAVARAAIRVLGGRYGRRALVVCGKGNNGGDGFVAARVLAGEGVAVTCMLACSRDDVGGDALAHLRKMETSGVVASPLDPEEMTGYDVYIDAILGTGAIGAPRGLAASAIAALGGRAPVVAVDIPSGVDGATGGVAGDAVDADVTVALGAAKVGTVLPPGSIYAGRLEIEPIGIEVHGDLGGRARLEVMSLGDVDLAIPPVAADSHKRSAGSVVLFAGSDDILGAPLLSATGAIRAGAGYVSLVSTESVRQAAAVAVPEAVSIVMSGSGVLGGDALDQAKDAVERADVVAAGPGLGTGADQRKLVERLVAEIDAPLVLDADALNVLGEDPAVLSERDRPAIVTPHPGELGRLLGVPTAAIVADRLGAALDAAERFPHTVIVAKGHRSIVAFRGDAVIVPTGGAELATAGTGDVLTGVVAAIVARGAPAFTGAAAAAFIHGLAGTVAGEISGPEGVSASDVAEAIPEAVRTVREASAR